MGNFSTVSIYSSSALLRLSGGVKFDLFRTKDISQSSMPSKYSAYRDFLLNALKSSVSSCSFPNFGTGVNLSPLVSREISVSVSFLFDN